MLNKAHQARPQAGWTSVPALVLQLSLRYCKTFASTAAPVGGVRRSSKKKQKVALSRLIAQCSFRVITERIVSLVFSDFKTIHYCWTNPESAQVLV